MKVAVYCGSTPGSSSRTMQAALELGSFLGGNGHTLVYGGASIGLMGAVSGAALKAGGRVIGVIPEFLHKPDRTRTDCTQIIVTKTMAERKTRMEELADAFLALPGGVGTLEEVAEVVCLGKLHQHQKPCLLYDIDGFYQPLKTQMQQMIGWGFLTREDIGLVHWPQDLDEIRQILAI